MASEPTDYLRVSYSSLGTFSSCPRKFEFDKLYPKRVRDGDQYAADTGKALHAGYQDYLTHGDEESAIWTFMQAFPFTGEYMQTNDYRGFDACLATLERMFENAKMTEYELAQIRKPDGTVAPAIEVPFEIRFKGLTLPDGRGIAVIGFIDAIMKSHLTGSYRTLDVKTSRLRLNDHTPKYKFDTQQVPYGIVVDHVAEGSVDSFEVLYLDCFIDLLEPKVSLYPFPKYRENLEEWGVTKLLQFKQLIRYMELDFFPRTDNGCLFYNSPCRYLDVCGSRDRESIETWFLMGEDPANAEPFEPWIIADIAVGG